MATFQIVPVVEARALPNARLWLRFSDGLEGIVDLDDELRRRPLPDAKAFARCELVGGGVAWPGGFDCSPGWLRARTLAGVGAAGHPNDADLEALQRHARRVPEISRFFGIVVRMFFSDHARPHFHAEYGDYLISIEIDGDGIHGRFPPSRLTMLFEWRDRHRAELMENWDRLRQGQAPEPIQPLS